jgi:hypothetical protein
MKKFTTLSEKIESQGNMDESNETWILGFDFNVDYNSETAEDILSDIQKRFKKLYVGNGSGGKGFDVSFEGSKKDITKVKKYIEKTYKNQLNSKYTNMYLDEGTVTKPMTFTFHSTRNAKQFAYDVSNAAIATTNVIGKTVEVTLLRVSSVGAAHRTLAKMSKKSKGKLTESAYVIAEWVSNTMIPTPIQFDDESILLECDSADTIVDVNQSLNEENQVRFQDQLNSSMESFKKMIRFAYENTK